MFAMWCSRCKDFVGGPLPLPWKGVGSMPGHPTYIIYVSQ